MSATVCPNCQSDLLPENVKVCPACGFELTSPQENSSTPEGLGISKDPETSSARINIDLKVGHQTGGQVTGLHVEQIAGDAWVGFSAEDVTRLLARIQADFQPRPFSGRSPYLGLNVFQEQDAVRFFGREIMVDQLIHRVASGSFVCVTGPSGSGKSSLVRAGLLHRLRSGGLPGSDHWIYGLCHPGRSPLASLSQIAAGMVATLTAADEISQRGLQEPDVLSRWLEIGLGDQPSRKALLVVDQFEEIFTQIGPRDENQRAAFIQLLANTATSANGRLIVVIVMRSDFIVNCASYPELNELLNQSFLQVGPMSPGELVAAIARPALQEGLRIDPELITQIVSEMAIEPGALPLMQFALQDLFEFERARGGGAISALTLDGYLQRGGLHKALERHADRAFSRLDENERWLARIVFSGLVQPGLGAQDTRRTARFAEITPANVEPERIAELVHKLADERLIITEDEELEGRQEPVATLAHERLLQAWPWLRHLVDENREAISLQNEIQEDARRWEENERDESYLYAGARLETARERVEQNRLSLSGLALAFIQASMTNRDEQLRRAEEARLAEQRRELENARQLAEAEKRRADQQSRNNRRLFALVAVLVVVAGITLFILNLALNAQRSASQSANNAETQAANATLAQGLAQYRQETAVAAEKTSQASSIIAEQEAEIANQLAVSARAKELAALAEAKLGSNLELANLLAVEAYQTHHNYETRKALFAVTFNEPRLIASIHAPGEKISGAFSSQDDVILVSTYYGLLRWNIATALTETIPLEDDSDPALRKMFVSADDRYLVGCRFLIAECYELKSFDLMEGKEMQLSVPLQGDIQFSSGASPTNLAGVVGIEAGLMTYDVDIASGQVTTRPLTIADGRYVPRVQIKYEENENQITTIIFHGNLPSPAINGNGNTLLLAQAEDIQFLDVHSGSVLNAVPLDWQADSYSAAFHPAGDRVALWGCFTISNSGEAQEDIVEGPQGKQYCRLSQIRIYDSSGAEFSLLEPDQEHDFVTVFKYSPTGRYLAAGYEDGAVLIWDSASGEQVGDALDLHDVRVSDIIFSEDETRLLTFAGEQAFLWQIHPSGAPMTVPWQDRPTTDPRAYVSFSPDGQRAATLDEGHTTLRMWDLNTGETAGQAVSAASLGGEEFSSLGNGVFLVEREPLQLWNAFTHAVLSLPVSVSSDSVIHLSGDRDILAVTDRAGYRAYDLGAGRKLAEVAFTDLDGGYLLRFDPFGRGLIYLSPNEDATFKFTFLDVETGAKVDQISVVPIEFIGALIDPDHTLAASQVCLAYSLRVNLYCLHGRLELWDTESVLPLGVVDELSTSLTGEDVSMSQGENDLPARAEFKPMAFVGEERRLIAWSPQGYVSWDVDPESWLRRACLRAGRNLTPTEWAQYFPAEDYRKTCAQLP